MMREILKKLGIHIWIYFTQIKLKMNFGLLKIKNWINFLFLFFWGCLVFVSQIIVLIQWLDTLAQLFPGSNLDKIFEQTSFEKVFYFNFLMVSYINFKRSYLKKIIIKLLHNQILWKIISQIYIKIYKL